MPALPFTSLRYPMRRFMLGGVAGKIAHHAPTSLLIVRED